MSSKPRRKRWSLAPGPLLFGIGFLYLTAFILQDIFQWKLLSEQKTNLTKTLETEKQRVNTLTEKWKQLQDPRTLEFLARDRLGYGKKGEILYRALFPPQQEGSRTSF